MSIIFSEFLWKKLKNFISPNNYPVLPCPYCNSMKLKLQLDTFEYRGVPSNVGNFSVNRHKSVAISGFATAFKEEKFLDLLYHGFMAFDHNKYDPGKFIVFFQCEDCFNTVSATGSALIPNQFSDENSLITIKAEYFSPSLPIFPIEDCIPATIVEELLYAFNYFHSDLPASGGKLRRAMEKMCVELGFSEKTLHKSIQAMTIKFPEEGAWLATLKLVGNEATHSDGLDETDLLYSFGIFEAALLIFKRRKLSEAIAKTLPKIEQKFLK
uniref:DUF4145 domain-containing protein n=1 Tax=Polaromonas sp. TaxID=1869339 RepID=UPI0015998C3A|nr:DUF4145 domain-containing protein [Polaromonas sp.]QJS06441.1 hypothetical protein [Polaromonas sp.]